MSDEATGTSRHQDNGDTEHVNDENSGGVWRLLPPHDPKPDLASDHVCGSAPWWGCLAPHSLRGGANSRIDFRRRYLLALSCA